MSQSHVIRHLHVQMACCMAGVHAVRHTAPNMSINMLRLHATRHFVLPHVKLHLLKRRASKNVILPKRSSDQSITLSNHGRAAYSTHGSLTINSSTTS
ncbi:hypothetical protein YC2023_020410 [Brassica napus]